MSETRYFVVQTGFQRWQIGDCVAVFYLPEKYGTFEAAQAACDQMNGRRP